MKEMAEKVRRDSGVKYGYVFQGAQDEGGVVDVLEHVWNAGGDVLDGDEVVVDSPESAESISLRRSMITEGVAPRATGDYTTQESQAVFTNGDAVFMRNWPFVYGLLSDAELSKVKPERVGISLIPVAEEGDTTFSGLGDGTSWSTPLVRTSRTRSGPLSNSCRRPSRRRLFALQSTRLPTLKNLYEDDEVLQKVPVAALGRESLQNTRPRPISPYYSDICRS